MLSLQIGNVPKPDRSGKGKSIAAFPSDYVVIDVETTGLDPTYCEIIELSAIKYVGGVAADRFTSLVKPTDPIDDYISKLTGITNEMLETAPSPAVVLPDFSMFISDSVLVGYNVNFDINFLYDNLLPLGVTLSNSFVDVLRIARRVLPDLPNHKLITVADFFGISPDISHRALADCETCNNCYSKLQAVIIEKYGSLDAFAVKPKHNLKASDITANTSHFDTSHPLYNKVCVFTGTLERMTRKEAMQIVADLGGICGNSVTKKTNYLILGNNDFCSSIKDGKSSKQKKAEALALDGLDIQIISENVFYELI
ncbi:MAG: exonuclease [Eubacterium sp.]|nr:exonuclease [Eubacterium sp.]DAU90558.1 MAG TPA: DNA polymerase III subunit alpha [Caudoviricetes sp.]DAY52299.1 MAG TPA: DNA polymerase III subunit alpha [Caudoviricetes sp.]